jgi:hypothetical protein
MLPSSSSTAGLLFFSSFKLNKCSIPFPSHDSHGNPVQKTCMYRLASWCLKESHTIRANFFLVFRMCFVSPIILICQKRWARRQSNMAFSPYLNHFSGNHQTLLSSFLKGFWTSQSQNTPYICYITKILQDLHNLTILFFLSSKNKQYLLLSKLTLDIILHGDCFFFSLNSNSNSMRGIF